MEMRILEKKGKKQIIFIPEYKAERKLIDSLPRDRVIKMKVSKGILSSSKYSDDMENVIVLTEQHI